MCSSDLRPDLCQRCHHLCHDHLRVVLDFADCTARLATYWLLRPLRPLHLSVLTLAVPRAAANRQMNSPVRACLAPSTRARGSARRVSRHAPPALRPAPLRSCALCGPCLATGFATSLRPSLGFLAPSATSRPASDLRRALPARLCGLFVVSHDLEALLQLFACGSVSRRSHP